MNVSLSLRVSLALLLLSCCENAGSQEEDSTMEYNDYSTWTSTPEYDYSATFDYYFVTGIYHGDTKNKAAGIGPLNVVVLLGLAVHQMWN